MINPLRPVLIALLTIALYSTVSCASDSVPSSKSDMTNWTAISNGAQISAGKSTDFLLPNDLASYREGNALIFRHGPRSLEKVLIVELPKPVLVRSVTVSTVYEDTVRVPSGFDISLSMTGIPDSFKPAGSVNDVHADRTLIKIINPVEAKFVRLSVRDSGGGSRIWEIGAYTANPDVVKAKLTGFEYKPGQDWLSLDEISALRKKFGSPKDGYLTMICGGLEYSAPPPPGEGTVLERYIRERGTAWRKYQMIQKELPYYSAMGTKSMEMYIRWNLVEDKPGEFDFSAYDAFLKLFKKNNLKWSPLVIMGPAYTLPEWFRKSPDYIPYRCLEHDRDNAVASLWNPRMRFYIDRFMKAFTEHYGKDGSMQNLMLGVTGLFGENAYPHESDKDWTTNATGDYHSHSGWWAGDPYARDSFHRYMKTRYKSIESLNAAWKTDYASFNEVQPIVPAKCRTPRARYDFMSWYVDSMTNYTEFWLKTARKYLPNGGIQLCVGGEGRQRVGTDFSRSAKLAAKYNIGIRITNESPIYTLNVAMTRWISTATRNYGTWLGIEPASLQIASDSIAQRVYNVRTSGATELFCYQSGLSNKPAYEKLLETMPYLKIDSPSVSTAYWMPRTHMLASGDVDYIGDMMGVREAVDFDAIDDVLISDGALKKYRVLVMGAGSIEDEKVLDRIVKWVEAGGLLIRIRPEPIVTIDGSDEYQAKLFGEPVSADSPSWTHAKRVGRGYTMLVPDASRSREQIASVLRTLLPEIGTLGKGYTTPPSMSGAPNVYGSLMKDSFLILNANPNTVTASYDFPLPNGTRRTGTLTLPEYSIRAVGIE